MNYDAFKAELIKDCIELNTKSDFDKKFLNSNRYLRSYKFEFNCLNIIS